jgi:hypothetical protein
MEEYVLPDEYTLPPVDNPQPQVKESAHRWSASSLWKDHKGKIIGGIVGGAALAAVAGGVTMRNKKREREARSTYDSSWGRYDEWDGDHWAHQAELDEDQLDGEKAHETRKRQLDPSLGTFDDLTFDDSTPIRAFRKDRADTNTTLYTFNDLPSEKPTTSWYITNAIRQHWQEADRPNYFRRQEADRFKP